MEKIKRTEYLLNEEFFNKLVCDVECYYENDVFVIDCQSFKISFEIKGDYFNVSHIEGCGLGFMELFFVGEVIERRDEIKNILTNDEDYDDYENFDFLY